MQGGRGTLRAAPGARLSPARSSSALPLILRPEARARSQRPVWPPGELASTYRAGSADVCGSQTGGEGLSLSPLSIPGRRWQPPTCWRKGPLPGRLAAARLLAAPHIRSQPQPSRPGWKLFKLDLYCLWILPLPEVSSRRGHNSPPRPRSPGKAVRMERCDR